jgi:putative ABC transport system permease protein
MILLRGPLQLGVLFYQSLFLALTQIWANKLRSILTTIGIVIGVASVTCVIAALSGLKENVLGEFESLGTNKLYIFPRRPPVGPMRNAPFYQIRFRPDLFDQMLAQSPSTKHFSRVTQIVTTVAYDEARDENVSVTGIEPAWHDIERRYVIMGRPFSLIDNERARPVCLINEKLRDRLGLPTDCTGQFLVLDGRRYLIVGLIEPSKQGAMIRDDASDAEVFVPFTNAWRAATKGPFFPFMYVMAAAKSTDAAPEAQAEIAYYLRKKRKIEYGAEDTFRVNFVDQFVQQFNQLANAITIVAGGIVGISLIVGGVGIMNIMLVSVSERTREIGLRKAVGAKPSAILMQFLVEAVMLCFFGGMVGLLIGQLLTMGIAAIPGAQLDKAAIPTWAVILSFGFAALVGLVFGMFPAIKAARLDPIDALRHE